MSGWKGRAFAVIRVILGVLLLSAAALKIYGWSVSTVPPVGWLSASAVQAAAIGWQILLGVWLLCGVAPFGSWLAAIGTFTQLAGISGYLGWIGQATCGCFGTIEASPWYAFAMDIVALLLLVMAKPRWEPRKIVRDDRLWRGVSPVAYFVLGVGLIVTCIVGMGTWVYGSPEAALAHLRGNSVVVKPDYIDCGTGKPGETLHAVVEILNWDESPVRIYGGSSDCTCVVTTGLPVTIQPGESCRIRVILKVPKSAPGVFTRQAELFTDCEHQWRVPIRVGCRVE